VNWYKKYLFSLSDKYLMKLAQIWRVSYGSDLEDKIAALYELEYKYSAVRDRAFNGLPERHDNILQNLQTELRTLLEDIKDIFIGVFGNWLDNHALLSANTWSNQRVRENVELFEGDTKQCYYNMLREFDRYGKNYGQTRRVDEVSYEQMFRQMLEQAMKNLRYLPATAKAPQGNLAGYQDMLRDDLNREGPKEFGLGVGKRFRNIEQAENWINKISLKDVDLDTIYYDLDQFIETARSYGYEVEVLTEFYKKFIFPHWLEYWKGQGIAETRKNIMGIYKQLQSISSDNVGNALAIISLAINSAHQTGDMLEYFSNQGHTNLSKEQFKGFLTEMSSGDKVSEWNAQLREAGVEI